MKEREILTVSIYSCPCVQASDYASYVIILILIMYGDQVGSGMHMISNITRNRYFETNHQFLENRIKCCQ